MADGRVDPGETGPGPDAARTPGPPPLQVGGLVAGGRYELLESHGGVAGQAFWRARDKRLGREVALTFVDPLPGEEPPGSATGVLDRTVALTGVWSDGLARVLDVIRGRAGGIVVSEWIPGRSLAAAASEPDPDVAVDAVRGLADAAARAEEKSVVLGLDSPDRIRLTRDGRALLAFPGVGSAADDAGDIRGLGAVLYALLTGAWPLDLPEGSDGHAPVDGRPETAPRGDDDELVDPTEVRPGVPPESAVLALRSLDGSSVSSAATVLAMVTAGASAGSAAGASRTRVPSYPADGPARAAGTSSSSSTRAAGGTPRTDHGGTDPRDGGHDGYRDGGYGDGRYGAESYGTDEPWIPPDAATLQRRWRIMAGTGAVAVIAVAVLAAWLLGAFTSGQNDQPLAQQLDAIERAAQQSREAAASSTATSATSAPTSSSAAPSSGGDPIEASDATSWQPSSSPGTAENAQDAPNVLDGDSSTTWSTDTYYDQFGAGGYKPGLGLLLTLDEAASPAKVVLESEDDDVQFEVRAADSASPTSLDDTTLLGKGTVSGGEGVAEIDDPEETEHVLVWITKLGTSGPGSFRVSVSEVTLEG